MALRLNGSTSGYVGIDAPATAASNTLVLPNGNGSNGQALTTNGSGTLSWTSITSSQWTTSGSDIYYTTGKVLVGTSTARSNLYNSNNPLVQFETTGSSIPNNWSAIANRNDAYGPELVIGKSRGTTVNSVTAVQSGDSIGGIQFLGADGTTLIRSASIFAYVDGTPGANDMPGRLVFSTTADGASNSTERMRIDNFGRVGMLATQQYFGHFLGTTWGANGNADLINGMHSATSPFSGTQCFIVRFNGNVQNTNNSYGAISDIKLKENVVDASSQWNDLKAIQVRKYNFKAETNQETHTQLGVIAQEVELISPGLVSESPDRDEDGNDLGTTTKSVNYSVLYMKAVKALQEAMERIETLEAANASLEARLTALEVTP